MSKFLCMLIVLLSLVPCSNLFSEEAGTALLNYHDDFLIEVAEDASEDIFIDNHIQFDISASQRIASGTRLFLEVMNMNDESFRRYIGFENRPVQREFYSWWITAGITFNY